MQIIKTFIILSLLITSFFIGAIFYTIHFPWIDLSILEHYDPGKPSILYDCNNQEWARFQLNKRQVIKYEDIPEHVVNAFISAEDCNFFKHNGISYKGILRSTLINLYHKRIVQGGSTITQQLVKLLFYTSSRNFKRKIKEQIVALLVEQQFSKEHILQVYLNCIYFGSGIYGIEAAAQYLWGIPAKELNIDQAAVLAGIVRSPRTYSPLYNSEKSKNLRNVILNSMYKYQYITKEELNLNIVKNLNLKKHKSYNIAEHLKENIRIYAEEKFGRKKLYTGGLKIYTTLDKNIQTKAEEVFYKRIKGLRDSGTKDLEGAFICLDKQTGQIRALIGGYDYKESQFNRAFDARRQIGSTFKPLIYATALENNISLADTAIDEPLEFKDGSWNPQNSNKKFEGKITLAHALSRSNNIVTIKTLLHLGAYKVIKRAKECYLKGSFLPYPALALGCVDSSLLELTAMFNTFNNNGIYTKPYFIKYIKDEWDNILFKNTSFTKPIFSNKITGQIVKVLNNSIEYIRKILNIKTLEFDSFGKTGTTNDFRTCWFAGGTPNYTTALYLGCDDNRSLYGKNVYASRTALPIWYSFNQRIRQDIKRYTYNVHLKKITIDSNTGDLIINNENKKQAIDILIDKIKFKYKSKPLF